jgi:hypothetical protein
MCCCGVYIRADHFRITGFAVRFYLYQFATAVVLAVIGFYPLLLLLFFHWIYPIISLFMPYQLITGVLLGREINRSLGNITAP